MSLPPLLIELALVFSPSEFAIINTDGRSDFDIEKKLTLRDSNKRKLDLRLNYVYVHPPYQLSVC